MGAVAFADQTPESAKPKPVVGWLAPGKLEGRKGPGPGDGPLFCSVRVREKEGHPLGNRSGRPD